MHVRGRELQHESEGAGKGAHQLCLMFIIMFMFTFMIMFIDEIRWWIRVYQYGDYVLCS